MASGGEEEKEGLRTATCKWFNVVRGYGFLQPNDGGQDVFVHQSVIRMTGFRSLAEGEEVEFECRPSDKGLEATHVGGRDGGECKGSERRPVSKKKVRKIRCYNCSEYANHIAAKCPHPPLPKRCHHCKAENHLIADCPTRKSDSDTGNNESADDGGPDDSKSDGSGASSLSSCSDGEGPAPPAALEPVSS